MNDQGLKKFDFRGASVRTVMIKGEPWWVAADVCAVLEIENSRDAIRKRLEKRQHWIKSIKGLNGALFVYAEHRGVDRRLQIQPNNVGGLLFELRVVADHIVPQPMGLNAVLPPDPINASRTNTQMLCQPVAAPMGSSIGRSLARGFQDFSLSLCRTLLLPRLNMALSL
jgi:BRO family, N-terminal domain